MSRQARTEVAIACITAWTKNRPFRDSTRGKPAFRPEMSFRDPREIAAVPQATEIAGGLGRAVRPLVWCEKNGGGRSQWRTGLWTKLALNRETTGNFRQTCPHNHLSHARTARR